MDEIFTDLGRQDCVHGRGHLLAQQPEECGRRHDHEAVIAILPPRFLQGLGDPAGETPRLHFAGTALAARRMVRDRSAPAADRRRVIENASRAVGFEIPVQFADEPKAAFELLKERLAAEPVAVSPAFAHSHHRVG